MRLALAAAVAAGCATPPPADGVTIADAAFTRDLRGGWHWQHTTRVDDVRTDEREAWELAPTADWLTLRGRYRRVVEVTALDGVPFTCAQAPSYRLASEVDVVVTATAGGARIDEVAYRTAPSPCDRGLRRLAHYHAARDGHGARLAWPGGSAHLTRGLPPPPPPPLAVATAPAGPWRWSATSWTSDHRVQREDEAWELAVGDDGALTGWYRRTVEVRDPDGAIIACAGAPGYRYVDRFLVRGARDPDGGWRFDEIAAAPDPHPCLAANPTRARDGAEVEVVGDALILTWRGARREVLQRPPAYWSEYAGL